MARYLSYRAVKLEILRRIRAGIWPPGALLPGEVEIAAEFGSSRATVNRAMQELADEDVLDRKRKTGTRVNQTPVPPVKFQIPLVRSEIEALGAIYRYALVLQEEKPAPDWLAARLTLPQAVMLHIQCLHFADERPYQFEDRWINLATAPAARDVDWALTSPNEWLLKTLPFTDAEIRFSATAADARLAAQLDLPLATPIFTIDRTTWITGTPVTNARIFCAEGYQMVARY